MAKREKDPGLMYMISLGLTPARAWSGVEEQIAKASDRKTAQEFLKEFTYRAGGKGQQDFYSLKNRSYDISMAISSAVDADVLRKACNWILANKESFGETILEVGCDCGIMSCFLGKTFPEAQIIAIDRCPEAIDNAKQLAEKLGVTNVTFEVKELASMEGEFDTVFSMRTMQENLLSTPEEDVTTDLKAQAAIYKEAIQRYAAMCRFRTKNSGNFISIEKMNRNALMLAWVEALVQTGFDFEIPSYQELDVSEIGEAGHLQAMIFPGSHADQVAGYNKFLAAVSKYMDLNRSQYKDWEAKIMLENKRGNLIEGYTIKDIRENKKSILALWEMRTDPTAILFYQNNNGNALLQIGDVSLLESQREAIQTAVKQAIEWNPLLDVVKM